MVLMGIAAFETGTPSAPVVSIFGAAPLPLNYDVVGEIQAPSDVAGTLAKYVTTPAADNAEIRGAAVGAADMLAADAALGGLVVPTWGAAGGNNERSVVLTYDGGAAPAGDVSVVRGVWKGVDLLIFLTFTLPPPPLFVFNGIDTTQFNVTQDVAPAAIVSGGLIRQDDGSPGLFSAWIDPALAPNPDFVINFTYRKTNNSAASIYMLFLAEDGTTSGVGGVNDKYEIASNDATLDFYESRAGVRTLLAIMDPTALDTEVAIRVEIFDLGGAGKRFVVTKDPEGTPVEIMDRTEAAPPPNIGDNVGLYLSAEMDPNQAALAITTVENA